MEIEWMEIDWIKTKYGYELIWVVGELADNQIALLKQDPSGIGEYYISCIDSYDTGREYLNSNHLEEAKRLTIKKVLEKRKLEIKDIKDEIKQLKKLLK